MNKKKFSSEELAKLEQLKILGGISLTSQTKNPHWNADVSGLGCVPIDKSCNKQCLC